MMGFEKIPAIGATYVFVLCCFITCVVNGLAPEKTCNSYGFYCKSDKEVQFCSGNSSVPDDTINICPPQSYCSMDCLGACALDSPCMAGKNGGILSRIEVGGIAFECTKEGRFIDPNDCQKYYVCSSLNGELIQGHYTCTVGSKFNVDTKSCSFSENVICPPPPTCTDNGFYCVTYSKVQLCAPGENTPSGFVFNCPPNTVCKKTCPGYCISPNAAINCPPDEDEEPFRCKEIGRFPDPYSCYHYYQCSPIADGFRQLTFKCPEGYAYDAAAKRCALKASVNCGLRPS